MDKAVYGIFLCLYIAFPISHECGTSDSPATYVLEPGQSIHIMSPNYPEPYPIYGACFWLVQAATDSNLKYRFIGEFEVGQMYSGTCYYGGVTLYDSSNATNVIRSYCGKSARNSSTTTGRYLYVILNSTSEYKFPGFNLEVTLKDDECSISDSPITYVLGSGHTINITSPNYPNNYLGNESLYWLVVTAPDSKLNYRFIGQFKLESEEHCQYDNVTLYDSSNTTNVIGSYCGKSRPNPGVTTGRYLFVSFKSDGRATFAGFNLEITSNNYGCGTSDSPTTYVLYPGQTLFITSPNYPDDYPTNKACYWLVQAATYSMGKNTIKIPEDISITIPGTQYAGPTQRLEYRIIGQFELESEDQCQHDSVTLYDSSDATNVIGSYCGSSAPNPGTTTGSYLYVSFKSDNRATYSGFNLEITSKDYVCELSESANTYFLRRGQLMAIKTVPWNNVYPTTESWLVVTTNDSKLRYRFFGREFILRYGDQCEYDNVTLYDSSTTTNVIGTYCGWTRPNPGITNGRYLYVVFKSDGVTSRRGFQLEIFSTNYECGTSDSPRTFELVPGHTLNLTSPNHPYDYPNSETCNWLVQAAPDSTLKYTFIGQFKLETGDQCERDSVTLYDSSNTTNVIGSYCGSSSPNPGTTTGRYLYVSFKSNDVTTFTGFNLQITSNVDGE